jgi:hypothetical protein
MIRKPSEDPFQAHRVVTERRSSFVHDAMVGGPF